MEMPENRDATLPISQSRGVPSFAVRFAIFGRNLTSFREAKMQHAEWKDVELPQQNRSGIVGWHALTLWEGHG
jgi:hypothetical protein